MYYENSKKPIQKRFKYLVYFLKINKRKKNYQKKNNILVEKFPRDLFDTILNRLFRTPIDTKEKMYTYHYSSSSKWIGTSRNGRTRVRSYTIS